MWLFLAFLSAALLGLYDTSKKASLKDNAVLPVLFLNTVFATLLLSPFLLDSAAGSCLFEGTVFDTATYAGHPDTSGAGETATVNAHLLVAAKSAMVLVSWIFGYFGLKHLPITIVGPINATRPVLVLVGALLFFGEKLNAWQWAGVFLAILSLFLLSRSGKKEHLDFTRNKWILFIALAAVTGAGCGLYDKFIMKRLGPMFVQSWYNFYQMLMMGAVCATLWYPNRKKTTPFSWRWSIPLISLFVTAADFSYLTALNQPDSMISVISLVRRSSVIVSFTCGALIFHEKNLGTKFIDLLLIVLGMIFIYIGS